MIVELLRPSRGVGPDLARRWLAALLLVPEDERPAVVGAVEASIAATYASESAREQATGVPMPDAPTERTGGAPPPRELRVMDPPVQREGYVERVVRTYEVADRPEAERALGAPRARRKGAG